MKEIVYNFSDIIENPYKKLVLIIYDIINNKTRQNMVKFLESYGRRVQKSAFEVLVTQQQYNDITEKIPNLISDEDNVRIYRLNSSNEVILYGESESAYEDEVIIV